MIGTALSFGSWLKRRRKELGLTQEELARRIACSIVTVQKIETDARQPSKQIAELLARYLDIPRDELDSFVRFARTDAKALPQSPLASTWDSAPWRSLHLHLTNLPVQPNPLIGRASQVAEIKQRLVRDHVRLLTLAGPPGIGKTRLAIQVAAELLGEFQDGVFFVGLAPISEPTLVATTIVQALQVKPAPGLSAEECLKKHLADKRILLLLDNFEQVITAATLVAELLTQCPWLHILVTSRASLHLRAERQFIVPPLALPSSDLGRKPETLLTCPAIALFVDRAQAIQPAFALTPENAPAVSEICVRLDGLPLAIELVAAHANAMSPETLLTYLNPRLALLTQGPRDLPARHQTLRDAIAWSYDRLDSPERELFARLSVFVDGCTLETMEPVCCDATLTHAQLPATIASLVDKNLIVRQEQTDGAARFAMLETIREYAQERLERSGSRAPTEQRHAGYFLSLAETAEPELTKQQQVQWLNRLEREHGNLRAALRWALSRNETAVALRLGGALWRFWYQCGHLYLSEGRAWLEAALRLEANPSVPMNVRASALNGAGVLAWAQADHARAQALLEECLTLRRGLGDQAGVANVLNNLGNIGVEQSDYARANAMHEESLALRRAIGDEAGIASSLSNLGLVAIHQGDPARAISICEPSLALERKRGNRFGIAMALNNLGGALADDQSDFKRATMLLEESLALSRQPDGNYFLVPYTLGHLGRIALYAGEKERARTLLAESLTLARSSGGKSAVAYALYCSGQLALGEYQYEQAEAFFAESLTLHESMQSKWMICKCLEAFAWLKSGQHQPAKAACLFGAAESLRLSIRTRLPPADLADHHRHLKIARKQLDEATWAAAWEKGKAMSLEQSIGYALSDPPR